MAEFKLGRIKFVYQGAWDSGNYVVDDVVTHSGKTYICIVSHTASASFADDYNVNPELSNWSLIADGSEWKGDWTAEATYDPGALVLWGGVVYICKEAHTASSYETPDYLGLENDSAYWDVFATSFDWKGDWTTDTRYKLNDLVSYGGYTYVCNENHISGTHLTDDSLSWDVFNAGIKYLGAWTGSSHYYKINDVVKHGADLWICTTAHTSTGTAIDVTKFDILVNGFQFENTWSNSTAYQVGDIVAYGGYTYTCIQNHTGQTPSTATSYWEIFTTGFNFQGDWLVGTSYKIGHVVRLGGYTYVATADNVGHKPPNISYWQRLNTGVKWTPTTGTYSAVSGTTVTGTGHDAKFDVVASGTTYTVTVTSGQGGSEYANGDTITIAGTSVGGLSPVNDITLTVTGQSSGVLTTVSNTGISVTWVTGVTYVLGDVVFFGASSFICVNAHVAGSGNRPDADTTGSYWNLLASGTEQAVMTTQGDMFFYGTNGPERLPIGSEGQVLRVKDQTPTWAYYGQVNNLVYVAPHGTDSEESGIGQSIDTPWKTLQFATQQIEKGYLNKRAAELIAKNKQFILKEVNNYIQYTYPGVCDPDKTERDAGIVLDAVVFDLSHGGNLKTTNATLAYYDSTGVNYISSGVAAQITEFIAAQTYMQELVGLVLSNTAPDTSYQDLNAVTTVAEQIIDTALVAEDGAAFIASSLSDIVINGLGYGTTSKITIASQPNTTISAKTGTYNEVLPIVVPRNTAIVGDELRSTVVQPKAAIDILVNDKEKTKSALSRIKAVIPAIVSNTIIAPTTGNTQTQSTLFTENASVASLTANVNTMVDIVANDNVPSYVLPTPTAGNYGYTSAYFNAARLINANKAFLKAEVTAWINVQIGLGGSWSGFVYQQTPCERDVGYVVDALVYDLTYGGNLATQIAARSYYSNGTLVEVGEKTQAKLLWAYVKTIIDDIASGSAISKSSGNGQTQVTSGTPGSGTAPAFAQSRIQEIYDTIDTGTAPTTIVPELTWPDSALLTSRTDIQARKSAIQAEAIAWIRESYPDFYYNNTTCSRDVGYIVDALCYDMVFGSNFLSCWNAMSYYRALTSTAVVLDSQLEPTLSIIAFTGASVKEVAGGPTSVGSLLAKEKVIASAELMQDIISNGITEAPAFVFTNPTGYNTSYLIGYGDGKAQIVQNYTFIKDEIASYMASQQSAVWGALTTAQKASCTRDVGYILDALQHDMTYGGNIQTLIVGSSYYSFSQLVVDSSEYNATIAAYTWLQSFIDNIVKAQTSPGTWTKYSSLSQVTTGTAGSSDAADFAVARIQDIIDWITNNAAPTTVLPTASIALASQELQDSYNALQAKRTEIQEDTVAWVKKFYQSMAFDSDTCYRDAGLIVDALSYDLVLGTNFNSIIAGKSYARVPAALVLSEQLEAEINSIKFIKYKASAVVSNGVVAQISNIIDDISSTIDGGAVPRFVWPEFTSEDAENIAAAKLIWQNKGFIKEETVAYITANYPSIEYSQAACSRDVGYIIDAVRYDLTYGGNFATRQAGLAYYSQLTSALQIDSGDKTATLAAYGNLKTLLQDIANGGLSSYTALQSNVSYVTGTGGDSTSATVVGSLIDGITDTITSLGSAPAESLASTSWVDSTLTDANTALQSARTTIRANVITYIGDNFPGLVYDETTCSRDVGLIIDAVGYDLMFGSNFRSIKAGMSYYQAQAGLVLSGQKAATLAAFNYLKTQVEAQIADSTALARASANMQTVINIVEHGVGETPEIHGTVTYNNNLSVINGAELLRANKEFLAYEATSWITETYGGTVTTTTASNNRFTTSSSHNLTVGDPVVFSGTAIANSGVTVGTTYYVLAVPTSTTFTLTATQGSSTAVDITSDGSGSVTVRYKYDADSCRRDMRAYIDAMVYDLNFPGNYKSLRAARLYNNAVGGSERENMFLVQNGTGLRNMTLNGLTGTLSNPNDFGTKRPTGGAYASLDPGFGPNDTNVWIDTRSCYTQNCTMFGYAVTGAKVDGALHSGGYRSMVANDYTTIISDGIGYWVTGSGALAELISVFNYYGYAGYLSELGGRIRAANGNSSYGTYGVVAEGVDTYEVPIYGTVDNRANDAYITNVVTDGVNEVLRVEYANAGQHYTNAVPTISGSGYNVVTVQDEFRDSGIFETRIVDLNDGNGTGGTSYVTYANAAQEGTATQISIAATDTSLTDAYAGMRIQVVAGTGAGQYANILTNANGTKVTKVYKDSFTPLTATATVGTGDYVTVSSNATLYADMPIYFSGTAFGNLASNTLYYVKALNSTTQFTVYTDTGTKAAIDLADDSGTLTVYAAGWDHVVAGTTIQSVLDLTTSYTIEPRINYTAPGYTATARTLNDTAQWKAVVYADNHYVAIANGATTTNYSTNGTSWSTGGVLTATSCVDLVYGGGEGATATAVIGGLGGSGAVLEANLTNGQVSSVTVISGGYNFTTVPVITFTGGGGIGATATATILNGSIKTVDMVINGSGYATAPTVGVVTSQLTAITTVSAGKNYFSTPTVTIAPPYSATAWSSGGSGTSGTYYSYSGNYYKATSSGTFTTTGPSHTSGSVANGSVTLLYVGTLATAVPKTPLTNYGVYEFTINNAGYGYTSIPTVTITDTAAKFVAIRSGASATSVYSTTANLGSSWTAGNSLQKTDLASVTYGAGVFVAVGGTSGTASAASSTDGITWIDRSSVITSLSAGSYGAVTYGNGVFVAVNYGDVKTSYSTNGVSWTRGGDLPNSGSNYWTSVAYGNGRFVAIQGTGGASTSVAYSIDNGVTWHAASAGIGSSQTWQKVSYGQGLFFAVASGTTVCATSPDGINWTVHAMPSSSNWKAVTFGNINKSPLWVAVSNTSSTTAASIVAGAQALGRVKVVANTVTEIRMVEPGSSYPKGSITATTATTNLISTSDTTNLVNLQPVEFTGLDDYGLTTNTTYYVVTGSIVSNTSFKVAVSSALASAGTAVTLTTGTGLSGTYRAGPIITITDPNHVTAVNVRGRNGDGVLGNPSFTNRGSNNATATASTVGDGYSDIYQNSGYINIANLYEIPTAGANVQFASITGSSQWYKLVTVTNVLGIPGNYTATFQINPALTTRLAPAHGDLVTTRLKYSQVRLTGHDFLYIGTGGQSETNYPYVDPTMAIQANQQYATGGGRVFFTSTDQDGNFNVGNLFGVQQATGTATLNASAFNLAGLQSLQLGAVTLGVGSAVITQFSTDPYFTANSDAVVPTQRAIKAFITSQIGGGQSSLNVNTLTAGQIYVAGDSISSTTGGTIYVTSKMTFTGGIDGAPVALAYFGQR